MLMTANEKRQDRGGCSVDVVEHSMLNNKRTRNKSYIAQAEGKSMYSWRRSEADKRGGKRCSRRRQGSLLRLREVVMK